jgi:hypothetical protein
LNHTFYRGEIYYKVFHDDALLIETQALSWEYGISKRSGGQGLGQLQSRYHKRDKAPEGHFSIDRCLMSGEDGGHLFQDLAAGSGIIVSERIEATVQTYTTQHALVSIVELRENVTGAKIEDYSVNYATSTITIFNARVVPVVVRYQSDDADLLGWNLINNGGFEGDLGWEWSKLGSGTVARISSVASVYVGLFSLAVAPSVQNDGVKYNGEVPVTRGDEHRFSFWAKGTAGDTLIVQWTDSAGQTTMTPISTAGTLTTAWGLHEFSFTPDEVEISDIRILNSTAAPHTFYLDEAMLREASPIVDLMKSGLTTGFMFDVVGYSTEDNSAVVRLYGCEVYSLGQKSNDPYSEEIEGQFLSAEILTQPETTYQSPVNYEEAYFGSKANGVYHTARWLPFGDQPTWETVNDGLPSLALSYFMVDPVLPKLYQYATLNAANDTPHGWGRFFRRSLTTRLWDEPLTISQIMALIGNTNSLDVRVNCIFGNLTNGYIYVSVSNGAWSPSPQGGWLIPSIDHGDTWETPLKYWTGYYGDGYEGVAKGDVIYITGPRGTYSDVRVRQVAGGAWVGVGVGSSSWNPRVRVGETNLAVAYVSGNGITGPDLLKFTGYLGAFTILQDAFDIAPLLMNEHWVKSDNPLIQRILKNGYIRKTADEWGTFTQYAAHPNLYDFMWVNDPANDYMVLGKRTTQPLQTNKHVVVTTTDEGATITGRAGSDPTTGVDSIAYNTCGGVCNGGFVVVRAS